MPIPKPKPLNVVESDGTCFRSGHLFIQETGSPTTLQTPMLGSTVNEESPAAIRGYGPMFTPKDDFISPRIRLKTAPSPIIISSTGSPLSSDKVTESSPPIRGRKQGAGRKKKINQSSPPNSTPRTPKYQPLLPRRQTRAMTKRRKLNDDGLEDFEFMFDEVFNYSEYEMSLI